MEHTNSPFEEFEFYREDPATKKIIFDKEHPGYKTAKGGLALAGIDIDTIETVDEYEEITSIRNYGGYIYEFIKQKYINRRPTTLAEKAMRALVIDNHDELKRLNRLASRKIELGLKIIK